MRSVAPALLRSLRAALGPDGLVEDEGGLRGYETGARYEAGRAALVVRPRTSGEVAAVVSACAEFAARIVPQGANTGLVGASTPDEAGDQIVLSLERLRGPIEIDAANRSVRVGAGVRLSALNEALACHDLFLPIDLGADPTVGGMVSTNTGGARFLRYGDVRRHVLGVRAVLGDGREVQLGTGLRKDNAGLDLRQMLIGAAGSLAIITEVELEAQLRPRQKAAALVMLDDASSAVPLLAHFERHAGEMLAAFEGMSRAAVERAVRHVPGIRNPLATAPADFVILVELASVTTIDQGGPDLDVLLQACLESWWETGDPATLDLLVARPGELWALRHAIPEGLRASGPVVGFDLSFRRGDLARFRARMAPLLAAEFPEFDLCDFGHIGDGGIHFNLVARDGASDAARVGRLRARIYDIAVHEFGGSFSAEHGLGRANLAAYEAYVPADVRGLAGAVQSAFTSRPLGVVDFAALAPSHHTPSGGTAATAPSLATT